MAEARQSQPDLLAKAKDASNSAYAPYSQYHVGAALLADDGRVVTGCNVENASYGLTLCAERVAISKAVSEGVKKFKAIALYAEKDNLPDTKVRPCGACLQVMAEFFQSDTKIICPDQTFILQDLLPQAFSL